MIAGTGRALALSFAELSARQRVTQLLDAASFQEILGPAERVVSPHLALLGLPAAFDDGVVIGSGELYGRTVLIAAQEGGFMGGGVGEVHGAKLTGLLRRALQTRPAAVLVLAESGGVRLHEANAGLIAVSEVMRALLDVRAAGIPVVMLIGGANGCFGGMGLIARCADHIVMSDAARMSMSGPEVIESAHGVEEFDARDRALVWRTTGAKHRFLMGDCDHLVEDDVQAFRDAAAALLGHSRPLTLQHLLAEHALLAERLQRFGDCRDALDIWQRLGLAHPEQVTDMEAADIQALRAGIGAPLPTPAAAPVGADAAQESTGWLNLVQALFGAAHSVQRSGDVLGGSAQLQGQTLAVVGTTAHAAIGVETALAQAQAILDTVQQHPGRAILLLVDTQGQRLRHRDELLCINRYMAHMGCCVDLARRSGHPVIGLVYDQALSGGFITSGLMADTCHALPEAEIRVMRLPAMSRVTKISEDVLEALSLSNPVFAPGVANYVAMGGIQSLWSGDVQHCLSQALADSRNSGTRDQRAALGAARGGRKHASEVAQRVLRA